MALVAALAISLLPNFATCSAAPVEVLQTRLDDLVRSTAVPGAQLVLTADGSDTQIDSGVGDLGTGTAFPDNAQVRIASNTKTFVATVVLQLVGEGRVQLDAPIERYLPGVVRGPGGDGNLITVRNLLQHTSGIPNYLPRLDMDSVAALRQYQTADQLIRLGLDAPAEFAPGSHFKYSNTNYLLVGKLIEQVTGRPVGVEVTKRILVPLDLRNTYWPAFPVENVIRGPHPRGYQYFDGNRVDITDIDPGWGLSDGALVSTGADLNHFFAALLAGRLLPPAELAEMQGTIPTDNPALGDGVGLGLFHRTNPCGIAIWSHGGVMDGFFVFGGYTPDRAITVSLNQVPPLFGLVHKAQMDDLVDAAFCG
ncbi:beta-lactamase family protein [Nocardia sp. NBC_00565]|uniref:serine hydrolase domain-containing protein n=1 Tax=Nocardia sp. NBC_00565 TaxID=2975993 RepID=UPI002E7FC66B|nr:serine hydrolase domain-containing protein [Nocardia sp. NBC_00565]WUC03259.1 beta-lactamase family protein [Nocardia sp. NBC_00565]